MITLQGSLKYAGNAASAPSSTFAADVDLPVFQYSLAADGQTVVRQASAATQSSTLSLAFTDTSYRFVPDPAFIAGSDTTSAALARQYALAALQSGDVASLAVTVQFRFRVLDSIELGQQVAAALCVPKLSLQPAQMLEASARSAPARQDWLAVSSTAFDALRKQVADAGLKVADGTLLSIVSAISAIDGDVPSIPDKGAVDVRTLLQSTGDRITSADATKLLALLRKASAPLFAFPLEVAAAETLSIGGTVTVSAADGSPITSADFTNFTINAEISYAAQAAPRILSLQFTDGITVTDGATTFSLTDGRTVLKNNATDPVRIDVKAIDGSTVWSAVYKVDDGTLGKLDIRINKLAMAALTGVPPGSTPDRNRKLRGQILNFDKACTLKGALVLIQAKAKPADAWKVVGAGAADASGNFSMPYPYGVYSDARAVASLAPDEYTGITIDDSPDPPDETIRDDFLYLLLRNPDCAPVQDGEECDCSAVDTANRLPDHADLIGSDAYTQDIGGNCVNLSKPNRTINEYAFKAIVRMSDPDVANYTLKRIESGLESIDVSIATALASGATSLAMVANAELAKATALSTGGSGNVATSEFLSTMQGVMTHVNAVKGALAIGGPSITLTTLADAQIHAQTVVSLLDAYKSLMTANDLAVIEDAAPAVSAAASALCKLIVTAIDTVGASARYELTGGAARLDRKAIALDNPVLWQDAPETPMAAAVASPMLSALIGYGASVRLGAKTRFDRSGSTTAANDPSATFAQAVSVATGHILHYKAVVKADGYSLGDLIYSLPLAPGQKKEIVVMDSSHTLVGAETQSISQNEQLAMGLVSERDIVDQLTGNISESLRGSSTADTRGISAGLGTGGQGYGGTQAYGGSGSAVIGVAGGWAQAASDASQDSSRDVAQFFGEKLRQSIMQNAEGYRQLNASVVTTVQEGQRYAVTTEVVANHNHCHALTMMYFEVLRHFAVYQELASAEECVFIPLLLTRFTTENIAKWRDVLAPALLPMPSDTYMQPHASIPNIGRQHPLLKGFDADQRIRTHYANVDFPAGAYDEERVQYIRGTVRLRVNLPRPRTRFDRILSFPITKQLDTQALAQSSARFAQDSATYAAKAGFTAGIYTMFEAPPAPPNPEQFEVLAREAIADAFMHLDANYQSVPPAQCMRIVDFSPKTISVASFLMPAKFTSALEFFAENSEDRTQWTLYAQLMGYPNAETLLNAHFKGNLIAEWDTIFQTDIVPVVFEKILDAITLDAFSVDLTSVDKYHGGERLIPIDLIGTTTSTRQQLPPLLRMAVNSTTIRNLKNYVTLVLDSASITYATSHFNGVLFSGPVVDDLLDAQGARMPIPENDNDKRNPRREDRYLAAKLIEHLNTHLEYYNKVLWSQLDPDRRFMLLDGFSIQVFDGKGKPIAAPGGLRSLASVVKNDVIAVAGNSIVMPVAPGYRVSGAFVQVKKDEEEPTVTLLDHYQPLTPVPPYRISVPSKGVFAEAVQGACNACEKIETERLQDWNRYPIGDEPTAISAVTPPTPTVTDWRAAFKDFAGPIVNVQNAPAAPAPGAGLAGLSDLLGKAGIFKDITGLDANQQNALKTLLSNNDNAKAFAEMAKEMAMQQHNTQNSGKIMDSIAAAKQSGDISKEQASQLTKDHLQQQIDGGKSRPPAITAGDSKLAQVTADAVRTGTPVEATQSFPDGTVATLKQNVTSPGTATIDFKVPGTVPMLAQPSAETCWAAVTAMLEAWKSGANGDVSVDSQIAKLGAPYTQLLANNQKLVTADKNALFAKLGLVIDPVGLSSAMPNEYLTLMQQYGPLWATVDGDLTAKTSEHAKLIYGMRGDGTATGTMLRIIDPRSGTAIEQTFDAFMREFEELARAGTDVALNGQIARFSSPISGEGASTDTVYDVLTDVARVASLGLTANPAAKLIPVPPGPSPYTFDHQVEGGWTGRTVVSSSGLSSTAIEFPIEHEMAGKTTTMPFRVLDSVAWDNARVTFGTDTFALPLTRRFLLAVDGGNASLTVAKASSAKFPLAATVQSHVTVLFGYVVDAGTGAVLPLDLTNAPVVGLDAWMRNGASDHAASTNKRVVLALYDLTLHAPNDEFQPKPPVPVVPSSWVPDGAVPGPANAARLNPLLSLWCANACDAAAADFAMARPPTSAMTDGMMPGAPISGSFYTDANEAPHSVWDDMDPAVRDKLTDPSVIPIVDAAKLAAIIAAWQGIPSPRWNSIFAHYKIGSDLPSTMVIDRSKPRRANLTDRRQQASPGAGYVASPVTKVAGQAAFDNIHMAPEMAYKGAAASMAPICHHDCLHLHWRWSESFTNKYLFGWSGGAPYAKAGAPMIPENQNLDVSLTGSTFKYMPVATAVNAMDWQIFMHHGMAYVTDLTFVGKLLPMLEATSVAELVSPPPWEQFYYHNRFWETGGADRTPDAPRLEEGGAAQPKFGPVERM
jgi:hypothetical protein